MLVVTPEVSPLIHLRVRLGGELTLEALDAARVLAAFDAFVPSLDAPCAVVVEVVPGTSVAPIAAGVGHYLLRRLLACTAADVRIVGEARLREIGGAAYLRDAVVAGCLRLFETLDDALFAPAPGAIDTSGSAFVPALARTR